VTRSEVKATIALAFVLALRLLGPFLIYPEFAGYAIHLRSATPTLVGLAFGVYGLAQALLQIPFGLMSDRFGRKPMIAFGLIVFAVGSIVAARATSLEGLLIGRALQGAGAVGSTILALVTDLTRDEVRTRAMALVGSSIGLSFAIAIVLGPILTSGIGMSGIFWLTACLAVLGIAVTYGVVPNPTHVVQCDHTERVPQLILRVVGNKELLQPIFGIFMLHVILTAAFLAIPFTLSQAFGLQSESHWIIYLPVLALSAALMLPAILLAEKGGRTKEVFLGAIALLAASQLALALWGPVSFISLAALLSFFTAFNIMEASLPSLVTKAAAAGTKGTAMGIFSTAQFFGIFVGGATGGLAAAADGIAGVFTLTVTAALLWFLVAASMLPSDRYARYPARAGRSDPPLSRQ